MRSFFQDVPREISEAAIVDGCTQWGAFFKAVLPQVKGGLAATALFVFILNWSDYLIVLVMTQDKWATAPLFLSTMTGGSGGQEYSHQAALACPADPAPGDPRALDPEVPRPRPHLRRDQALAMSSITLKTLSKHFGALRAVDNLDLEVPHGSFTALLGPSGCGKTTTMNMISGLEKPTTGEVFFDERPMSRVAIGERNVGFVFQNYAIFTHHLGVREPRLRAEVAAAQGARRRRPRSTAASRRWPRPSGLSAALDRPAARLSVNDLQKVALGRSMIMQPTIFLLDEPFSNLDSAFRAYMRAELKRIQHEVGQTMVYVTHDQVEAMGMADRIAVMDRGRLQQYGSPDDLYERPANTFVARFIGSVLNNFIARALRRRRAARGRREHRPSASAAASSRAATRTPA